MDGTGGVNDVEIANRDVRCPHHTASFLARLRRKPLKTAVIRLSLDVVATDEKLANRDRIGRRIQLEQRLKNSSIH